ncbi:hypothetical protein CABS03_02252 [Colletotrichum abscissum]|uniref:DNA2/NAM7 helicase-like C-terminal domain-containing protein n=2 Tax=Colletotrichum abscissum TaxID=1671311 RepID=A0A9P9X7K4_9PEZI|nr:hypothetical protein CABS02_10906 [Colletotrichum abscissum]
MAAVSTMATASEGTFHNTLWQYTAKFQTTQSVNIIDKVPALADILKIPKPHNIIANSLKECPARLCAYIGVPGSGKTTFALRVLALMVANAGSKAVWSVHSNELCNDAVRKIQASLKDPKGVVRLHTLRATIAALTGRSAQPQPQPQPSHPSSKLSAAEEVVSQAIATADRESLSQNVLEDGDSLANYALYFAQTQGLETFHTLLELRDKHRLTDEEKLRANDDAMLLLNTILPVIRVLVGTPYAVSEFARATKLEHDKLGKWSPNLIVIDEAGRMPESQWWMAVAYHQPELIITMGDPKQFNPMSKSLDSHGHENWRSTFGPQRRMPIITRAEKAGGLATSLITNNRNHGRIAEWAADAIYGGRMNIVKLRGPVVDFFRDLGRTALRLDEATCNSFMVNIPEGDEKLVGVSYANVANRNYTFHLIFQLFQSGFPSTLDTGKQGNMMVICGYSSQLALYQQEWAKFKANAFIKDNVSFRTVDDSMSAEADIVIFDTVRSLLLGFLPHASRMAVAATRGCGLMITLVNATSWTKRSEGSQAQSNAARTNLMLNYWNWHFARGAIANTRPEQKGCGFNLMCTKCNCPGHEDYNCGIQIKKRKNDEPARVKKVRPCKLCKGSHHHIYCDQEIPSSAFFDETRLRPSTTAAINDDADQENPDDSVHNVEVEVTNVATGTRRKRLEITGNIDPATVTNSNAALKLEIRSATRAKLDTARAALSEHHPEHPMLAKQDAGEGVIVNKSQAIGRTDLEDDDSDQGDGEEEREHGNGGQGDDQGGTQW